MIVIFILSALSWIRIRSLWKFPDGSVWAWGNMCLVLMGGPCSVNFIQFSVDGEGSVPSLLFGLRQNYGRGNGGNDNLPQKLMPALLYSVPLTLPQATVNPRLCQRILDTHRQAWVSLFWEHCSFLLSPGAHKVLFVPSKSLFPQSCGSSVIKSHWPPKSNSLGFLSPFARSPHWEICCGS